MPAWLRDPSGVRIPVRPGGTSLGRDATSGVVVPSEGVSRRQLLLFAEACGTQVVVLNSRGLTINGQAPPERLELRHGDVIALGGLTFAYEWVDAPMETSRWALELAGHTYGVDRTPFVVGGGDQDDLVVPSWPPACVTIYATGPSLVLEPSVVVNVAGRLTDEHRSLRDRDTITVAGVRLRVRLAAGSEAVTLEAGSLPTSAMLELLPNGGLLALHSQDGEHAIWLPDCRCDLVAALLSPARGGYAGSFVPDSELIKRVWPGATGTRAEFNTLVYRVRQTLTKAGLDGPRLIERSADGSATRFALADGARVDIAG